MRASLENQQLRAVMKNGFGFGREQAKLYGEWRMEDSRFWFTISDWS